MRINGLTILLPALLYFSLGAAAQTRNRLPSHITTLDGKTYQGVAPWPVSVWPDGIVVQYQPAVDGQLIAGAVGEAKLKFRDLPDEFRNAYAYDAKAAADFEAQQVQSAGQWPLAPTPEERALMRFRYLAEFNRSLGGDQDVSYSVSMDAAGKITMQGVNRTTPAMVTTNVTIPAFTWFGYRNGLQTDYMPVQVMPGNSTFIPPRQ